MVLVVRDSVHSAPQRALGRGEVSARAVEVRVNELLRDARGLREANDVPVILIAHDVVTLASSQVEVLQSLRFRELEAREVFDVGLVREPGIFVQAELPVGLGDVELLVVRDAIDVRAFTVSAKRTREPERVEAHDAHAGEHRDGGHRAIVRRGHQDVYLLAIATLDVESGVELRECPDLTAVVERTNHFDVDAERSEKIAEEVDHFARLDDFVVLADDGEVVLGVATQQDLARINFGGYVCARIVFIRVVDGAFDDVVTQAALLDYLFDGVGGLDDVAVAVPGEFASIGDRRSAGGEVK